MKPESEAGEYASTRFCETATPALRVTEVEFETKAGAFDPARVHVVLAEVIGIPLIEYAPPLALVADNPAQLTTTPLTPTPEGSRT